MALQTVLLDESFISLPRRYASVGIGAQEGASPYWLASGRCFEDRNQLGSHSWPQASRAVGGRAWTGTAQDPRSLTPTAVRPTEMKVRLIQLVIGLACTLFFLGIAFYRVQLGAVSAALAAANPAWIVAAMLIYAVNLALRAWRWQAILRPVAAIPFHIVVRALLVGYGLNAVMPARLGELFRAEFFKKTFGLSRIWG
jgi:hypothetical protein